MLISIIIIKLIINLILIHITISASV